jgi:hypothetical protein
MIGTCAFKSAFLWTNMLFVNTWRATTDNLFNGWQNSLGCATYEEIILIIPEEKLKTGRKKSLCRKRCLRPPKSDIMMVRNSMKM